MIKTETITHISDLEKYGRPEDTLSIIGEQVSAQIAGYNQTHPHEMLPKTDTEIQKQFLAGETLLVLTPPPQIKFLFHGTLYHLLNSDSPYHVVEFGSVITHPDHRGQGLGTYGCREMIHHVKAMNHQTVCLSTIKREVTQYVLESAGMVAVSFFNFPGLTSLTCTCDEHLNCPHKRQPGQEINLKRDHSPGKIPCTLMISDLTLAVAFESYLLNLNRNVR